MTEAVADVVDETQDAVPAPQPARCGCCRKVVQVRRSYGTPEMVRWKLTRFHVTVVTFPCDCQKTNYRCLLCSHCPDCCKCKATIFEVT